jgi:molecular chaperone HtpG
MACRWNCDGSTSTRIEEFPLDRRGTRVTCCLEDDAREFLKFECIEKIIHRFLDYAPYPIFLEGRQVNVVTAPWHLGRQEREELPSQCYYDLYQRLNQNDNRPLGWFHIESDFPVPVRAVLFVPDRSDGNSGNLRLFANRTFISDGCTELLADWLGFIDGIVDTQDLPLNVARDRFQKDKQVTKLRNHITARTLQFLAEMLEKRRKDYVRLWEHCGQYLKRGYLNTVIEEQRSISIKLEKLILFPSSRKPLTTLDEYLERVPDSTRPVIFYLTNLQEQQSHLELFRSRNREVLFLTDRVDAALVQVLGQAQGNCSFVRIDQIESIEDLQFKNPEPVTDSSPDKQTSEAIDWNPLLDLFREIAGTSITKASVASLPSREIPAILSQTEEAIKQDAFNVLLGNDAADTRKWRLIVNKNCPLIQRLGQLGPDICEARLPVELVAQIWINVRLGAGLLEGQSLFEAVSCRHAFLNLIAEQMLGTKSPV